MNREGFETIPGEPHYTINRRGDVFSLRSARVLATSITTRRYAQVKLGTDRWRLIHRLVALTFVPNPACKPQVNHIDGDTLNNAADNLEWVTQSENQRHAIRTGLQTYPKWTAERRAKLSASLAGRTTSLETRQRISDAMRGKARGPMTQEHRARISESVKRARAKS